MYDEKPNLDDIPNPDFDSVQDKNSNNDNDNTINPAENVPVIAKKNRTLQFYKFLFYSMKTEIKIHDFLSLIRTTNVGEISLWIISIILYANTPSDFPRIEDGESSTTYKNVFIWFHIIHVIRACIGIFIAYKLPRSYEFVENIKTLPDTKLETNIFNDIIREQALELITNKIKPRKIPIFIYFAMTFVNFIFDVIDFLVILSGLSDATSDAKVVLITYMLIACLYITIDLSYLFWAGELKYIFPPKYLGPIDALFNGTINKALITFKLKKEKTDVVQEAKAQASKQPYVKSAGQNQEGGVNILEFILGDTLGVPGAGTNVLEDGRQSRYSENRNENNDMPGSADAAI